MESEIRPDFVTLHDALVERVEVGGMQVHIQLSHFCLFRQELPTVDGMWSCTGRITFDGASVDPPAPVLDDEVAEADLLVDDQETPWLMAQHSIVGTITAVFLFVSGRIMRVKAKRVTLEITSLERLQSYRNE
jgi:hypothetical protein